MYTFIVWAITIIIIVGVIYFLFRRPKRDAQYDNTMQTMDKVAQNRDKNVPDQSKWNGLS